MIKGLRRTVTITPENYKFICEIRGNYILTINQDIDFTTTLDKIISFAKINNFTLSKEVTKN